VLTLHIKMDPTLIKVTCHITCKKDKKTSFVILHVPRAPTTDGRIQRVWVGGWTDEKTTEFRVERKAKRFVRDVLAKEIPQRCKRYMIRSCLSLHCDHKEFKWPENGKWCAMDALLNLMQRVEKETFCRKCPTIVPKGKGLCSACVKAAEETGVVKRSLSS
jgi:hypothetical protein